MPDITAWLDTVSGWVWGPPMLILLFGTHLFLTVRLRFIQRYIGRRSALLQRTREGEGDVSQFGALTTALAATIGTGQHRRRGHGGALRRARARCCGCG